MEAANSNAGSLESSPIRSCIRSLFLLLGIVLFCGLGLNRAQAELQFDVFMGYDTIVREAGWFPVTCEVFNDGPTFNAVIEISSGNVRSDQVRRIPVELPTNTRKRLTIPMFALGGRFFTWDARLLDERGRVRVDRKGLQTKSLPWEGFLLGALPRTFSGMPNLPDQRNNRPETKPQVARIPIEQLPDNPIAYESLNALYLNSEKALSLSVNQVAALLAWVHAGGHLIISVEQLADVTATPWLQQLLPCTFSDMVNVRVDDKLQEWIRRDNATIGRAKGTLIVPRRFFGGSGGNPYSNLGLDSAFDQAVMPVAVGAITDGKAILSADGKPLIVEATRGRGAVTLLTFNPEKEPFHSWKNRPWFWSKLANIPDDIYAGVDMYTYGGISVDGIFGALIDSRQVQKLPVKWLLLLLVVYLIVIGPLDQYWLKRIGKQMLTWITFPTYVVLFSLLIYFIGYKLRAGETEWNELHVVDILPRGGTKAELRGRTFASIYSSSNARYKLAFTPPSEELADRTYASFRGELLDLYGTKESSRASVEQYGNIFRADIDVPVWANLLYVNDWLESANLPMRASVTPNGNGWKVVVENLMDRPLSHSKIVIKSSIYDLGAIPAGEKKEINLDQGKGAPIQSYIQQQASQFQATVESRRQALGDSSRGQLNDPPLQSMVASFPSYIQPPQPQRGFVSPAGLDLVPLVDRGDVVLLAWDADHSFVAPINQFKPPRGRRNTLLRLSFPITGQPRT